MTLADRLRSAIDERKKLAEAATQGEWIPEGDIYVGHPMNVIVDWVHQDEDLAHIVANQPGAVLRRCEADLKLLDAHIDYYGTDDDEGYPIPTLSILAEAYGVVPTEEWV